jgi:hypothetical protein
VARRQGEFERRAVESFALDDGSFFVTTGLEAGDRIVVVGAQQLLSAEVLGESAGGGD